MGYQIPNLLACVSTQIWGGTLDGTTWNQAMKMEMGLELLIPAMKDRNKSKFTAKSTFVIELYLNHLILHLFQDRILSTRKFYIFHFHLRHIQKFLYLRIFHT